MRAEKDTLNCRNLRRIIAGLHGPPSRLVPRHRGLWAPHGVSLHGCRLVYGSGLRPIRQSLLNAPLTVDPAGPQRGDHPTVQLPINPQRPCEPRRIPILTEVSRKLSHFRNHRGCDFAFMLNNAGLEPAIIDQKSIAYTNLANCFLPERRAHPAVPLLFEQPNPTRLLSGLMPEVSNRLRDSG